MVHTPRGAAAYKMFADSMTLRADQLVAGMLVKSPWHKGFVTVSGLRDNDDLTTIDYTKKGENAGSWNAAPEDHVFVGYTADEKAAKAVIARAYQSTLTAKGKARKR